MSEEAIRTGFFWVVGGVPMALGSWIAFFNVFRHWEMHRIRKQGRSQNISGVGCFGSFFFLVGWWISPLAFSPWGLLILLSEGPGWVTISPAEEEPGATSEDSPKGPSER